jgi:carboxyl-terminal processing protease
MIRLSARLSALLALLVAWGFAAGDRLPMPSLPEAKAAVAATAEAGGHDLASLSVFNRVVLLVKDNYFDPKRIEPARMLVDSLDYVEKTVPEVLVDGDVEAGKVKVTVGSQSKVFEIGDVDSIFKMSMRLHQVMGFVQAHLGPGKDAKELREIEYALVNGMLSSLDPHSVLLKPEYFQEMKLSTKGEFGGLGFVISMREGNLTVMKVLKGTKENPTPAMKAGIKPKDRILRIADESTVNMDLNSAVERLRGRPGSKIAITVHRDGWPEPRVMTLARAKIEVQSVESKLLAGNVGYVRITNFQGNTARDLIAQLGALRNQAGGKLAGVVLDLRGNPGGLLEQAIQVSDVFLEKGTIVTTVGMSDKLREVKKARADGTEKDLPVAVLVNSGSASASEIVSGALKNLNRAVVIGRTTFGKGSVQVLYDFPDESALKLTIAQYLTPGDLSIQETGITPDVELIPARVTKDNVSAFAPPKTMREADLDHHLANPGLPGVEKLEEEGPQARPTEKALYALRYLRPEKEGEEEDEALEYQDDELTEEFLSDFQITFARDLLLAAPHADRAKMLKAMETFVPQQERAQATKIGQAIQALGIDWTDGPSAGAKLAATVLPTPKVKAGEKLVLAVEVKNEGTAPFRRLRAWTESESNPYLDRREFLFGTVAPGASRTWTVPVELPEDLASRRDPVVVKFADGAGEVIHEARVEVDIVELPKPQFAFSYQVLDREGDGDGLPDPGEKLVIAVDIENTGAGPSSEVTFGSLKNEADEKVFLSKGRFKYGAIPPGQTVHGTFELELKPGYTGETMPLRLTVFDEKLEEILVERLEIPVDRSGLAARPAKGSLEATGDLAIRAAPLDGAPTVARAKQGAILPVDGKVGEYARVEWAKGRFGFVPLKAGQDLLPPKKPVLAGVKPEMWRIPPKIDLDLDTSAGGAAVEEDRFSLSGTVTDPDLRDVYVFVNDQKVYFSPGGQEPLRFTADFPLKEGSNHVVVVAREGEELASRRAFTVLRRPSAAVAAGAKAAAPGSAPEAEGRTVSPR